VYSLVKKRREEEGEVACRMQRTDPGGHITGSEVQGKKRTVKKKEGPAGTLLTREERGRSGKGENEAHLGKRESANSRNSAPTNKRKKKRYRV